MAFGAPTGMTGRTQNHSVNVAEKLNNKGDILDMTGYGGKQEKTEESYSSTFTNTSVNGQTGTAVISAHNLIESNVDYARESKTTVTALATAT